MSAVVLVLQLAASAALQAGPVARSAPSTSVASSPADVFGRRAAVSAGAALAASLLSSARANAYDSLPEVKADFAASEQARKEKEAKDKKLTAELVKLLKVIESSRTEAEFIPACDAMAVWVIGQGYGAVPDGIGVKNLVARIKLSYDNLPKRSYKCEKTRDNNGICYSPGRGAELAYEALIKQIRKYTIIQLGDYRRVEFYSF